MRFSIVGCVLEWILHSSGKLPNMLVDSVFYADYESDVELWFRARNATPKSQFTFLTFFNNLVKIRRFSSFDPVLRPEIKTQRKDPVE